MLATFAEDDLAEDWVEEEENEQLVDGGDEEEHAWGEDDILSVPEEVARYIYAQHLMGSSATPRPPSKYTQVKQQQ
eukprot:5751040-Amphidinium_carterae.5